MGTIYDHIVMMRIRYPINREKQTEIFDCRDFRCELFLFITFKILRFFV